jgi:hypothetical protein
VNPAKRFRRDFKEVASALDEQGWKIGLTRKRHLRFESPTGLIIYSSGTPSDWRARKNLVAHLRRAGLDLESRFD